MLAYPGSTLRQTSGVSTNTLCVGIPWVHSTAAQWCVVHQYTVCWHTLCPPYGSPVVCPPVHCVLAYPVSTLRQPSGVSTSTLCVGIPWVHHTAAKWCDHKYTVCWHTLGPPYGSPVVYPPVHCVLAYPGSTLRQPSDVSTSTLCVGIPWVHSTTAQWCVHQYIVCWHTLGPLYGSPVVCPPVHCVLTYPGSTLRQPSGVSTSTLCVGIPWVHSTAAQWCVHQYTVC